jgi:hypothetical protein
MLEIISTNVKKNMNLRNIYNTIRILIHNV